MGYINGRYIKAAANLQGENGTAIFDPDGYYMAFVPDFSSGQKAKVIDHNGKSIVFGGVRCIDDVLGLAAEMLSPLRVPNNHIREFDSIYSSFK